MMRIAAMAFILLLGVASIIEAAPVTLDAKGSDKPIRVTLDGDRIVYDWQAKKIRIEGDVRISVANLGYLSAEPIILTESVELNLDEGLLIDCQNGTMLAGPGLAMGQRILFDSRKRSYLVQQAQGYILLDTPEIIGGKGEPTFYFKAEEVGRTTKKEQEYLYILRGAVTTCDKETPHWLLTAKELRYNTKARSLTIVGASLKLYGIRFPTLPRYTMRFNETPPNPWIPKPGFSSREGLYLGFAFDLTDPEDSWYVTNALRLSTRQGITGRSMATRQDGPRSYGFVLGRHEWVTDDITTNLELDRYPEFNFSQQITGERNTRYKFTGELSTGYYRERVENAGEGNEDLEGRGTVSGARLRGGLRWVYNPDAETSRRGLWYGAHARGSIYSGGERYGDLELFGGMGTYFTDDMSGWINYRHHFTTGSTPFLFDDVDIEKELEGGLRFDVGANWTLRTWARYDLDEGEFSDYEIGVSREFHCLTWGVFYRNVGDQIGISLDLTGFTGGTKPYGAHSQLQQEMEALGLFVKPAPEVSIEPAPREDFPGAPPVPAEQLPDNIEQIENIVPDATGLTETGQER